MIPTIYDLAPMPRAYLECAAWSSNDESDAQGGQPFDQLDGWRDKLSPETVMEAERVCDVFKREYAEALADWTDEQAGHDLWLTRCGHGSGFWDRDFGTERQREWLSNAAHALGNVDMILGDEGMIYIN